MNRKLLRKPPLFRKQNRANTLGANVAKATINPFVMARIKALAFHLL